MPSYYFLKQTIARKFSGHSKPVTKLRVHKSGKYFASYSDEGFINLYFTENESPASTILISQQKQLLQLELFSLQKQKLVVFCQFTDYLQFSEVELHSDKQ